VPPESTVRRSNLNKPTILVAHGWSLNPATKERWQALMSLLEQAGYPVKYLDMPGFELPLKKAWQLNDYAQWLMSHVKQADKCVLLAHSFGGQMACRVAATQPKNLQALVLIGPAGIIDQAWHKQLKRKIFGILAKVGNKLPLGKVKKMAQRFLYLLARERDYYQAPPLLKETMSQVIQDEILNDLKKILVPCLIFWGERDGFTPVKHAKIFAEKIKSCELITIPNAGHSPHYYMSEPIAEKIIKFLQKVEN
jgi:pimeloyl-ACP methyl ester carboxylesterase